jgi:dipeptidyl aminopeptidase/acylaminoacyl peptidase
MNASNGEVPIIPRKILFGNPDRTQPRISPDGRRISFIAPHEGVLNVWVAPADNLDDAAPVTRDTGRGIREHYWAYNSRHVLYVQDRDGDENWRVYSVDLETGDIKDLTPLEGVQARVQELSPAHPGALLVAINERNPQLHDLYRVDLQSGQRELVLENPGFIGFETDDFAVRLAQGMTPDGGLQVLRRKPDGEWDLFAAIEPDDTLTTGPVGFDASGEHVFMVDSRERDTAALVQVNLASGLKTTIAEDPRCDVAAVERHPTDKHVQAVCFNHERKSWVVVDTSLQADFEALAKLNAGDVEIESRTLDDQTWILSCEFDNGPRSFYRYDRATKAATFLFTNRTSLEGQPLVKMQPVIIRSRDGHELVSYLSLPAVCGDVERPAQPVPMVLLVHGGPWARDEWGYDPWHQWLANRGYAVLAVNFRGSTGFGKAFINAANKEWGGRMHDDLLDAVGWATAQGIADPNKVAIFGGSYGGYAVLWGLTSTPETFACGVNLVGVSNLRTLLESVPEYWKPMLDMFTTRVGDHRTEEGQALLRERSPLTHVDQIRRPLLIGHGANDPRVKQAESDQIVAAMQAKGIPVTYVLYPDEGHGFARPENNLSFNAVAEAFLARHLGGRCEPVGSDFAGASIDVKTGADEVPGLAEALEQ